MKKYFDVVCFAFASVFVIVCASCQQAAHSAAGPTAPRAAATVTAPAPKPAAAESRPAPRALSLAFVTNNTSSFWFAAHAGVNKAVEDTPNISVRFIMPMDGTVGSQTKEIDQILPELDGIAISPVDPANETAYLNSIAEKAMLITQDVDAPESKRALFVGIDNVAAGRQAGELLKRSLPNGGKIAIFVGSTEARNAKDRIAGLQEAIKDSGITVVAIHADNTDVVRCKANVSDALVANPDIAGMVGIWSYNGPQILSAVTDAGKVGKIKIVCFDETSQVLAGVKAGSIEGTVVQQPFELGRQSIVMMSKILRGDSSGVPQDKRLVVPMLVITKANVDDYSAKLQEYLGTR